ncbi:glycosyltransferase family 4 protein [Streptomyces yaanensis]|uniref:Glycosyltransferase family 4 protein n=1 Tax=Streptomyces yaanensis TaxID=1142239 RepID=A0ABV7S9T4_9ACTN|nr:glycosyltransferase family 4 protein [Streptomyces sp. CGMCC 4.7035]WNB96746.1 glycosyltransferase family 4 protein [Streptomyces sp. CGMCC 4.7035]
MKNIPHLRGVPSRVGPGPYRVALVHSFYSSRQPSGENAAVRDQAEALGAAGHEVTVVAAHTDSLEQERGYAVRAAVRVATGRGRSPLAELEKFAPDVVHVHNLFPNFGTEWLDRWRGALVATMHNYRPACAAGTLFRDGKACTRCPDGDRWEGLRRGCYRGSRFATAPLAWALRSGAAAHPVLRRTDRIVVLSERSRDLYLTFGLPAQRIVVVPNFVDVSDHSRTGNADITPPSTGPRWLFIGRLGEEKGILQLLQTWPRREHLDVIGSGPLESKCQQLAPDRVRFLGSFPRKRILDVLPGYTGLIFSSLAFENAPLVLPEALASGVPILARAGSSVADSVRKYGTGAVYHTNDELPRALQNARTVFPGLREHCRKVYTEHYTAQSWNAAMTAVYEQAVSDHGVLTR